jgi:hypothetical protein
MHMRVLETILAQLILLDIQGNNVCSFPVHCISVFDKDNGVKCDYIHDVATPEL